MMWERSISSAIRTIAFTASTGNFPVAVSAESITASVPSMMALATSEASARVGRGFSIIDSSICVAVITGRLERLAELDHPLLRQRHLLEGELHAQVAARHHGGGGDLEDGLEVLERQPLLDLHHHERAAGGDAPRAGRCTSSAARTKERAM